MSLLQRSKPRKRSPLKNAPLRVPGQSLDEEIDRVLNERILFCFLFGLMMLLMGFYLVWHFFNPITVHPLATAIVVIPATACSWCLAWRQRKHVRNLRLGRDGERIVAEALNPLRQRGFVAIHDLVDPDGKFNIDHVLVGRSGVYVIETKTWSKPHGDARIEHLDLDTIRVAGASPMKDPLPQARANARWVADQLKQFTGRPIKIQPVVIFPGWFVNELPTPDGVWVLNENRFLSKVKKELPTIDNATVKLIATHLARSSRGGVNR